MKKTTVFMAFALGVALAMPAAPAAAVTFRHAFQGDLKGLDPYTLNETFTQAMLGNVYEGLTRRDANLKIVPGLAESWETPEPTRWRFHLRRGVKFAGGEPFTADDVIFSFDRVRQPESEFKTRVPSDARIEKIDDYTIDFVLARPNPTLPAEWDTWYILSKSWAEANGATNVQPATGAQLNAFALKSNGTGPYIITSHEPGVKTTFKKNPGWWGWKDAPGNVDEVVFTTIKQDATRVAALLSGELDMIEPVPVQDMQRVASNSTTDMLAGPELRTIHLFMDQKRDELKYSSVKGKNPFKDIRVRKAFYEAIDIEAIKTKVMRGMSTPAALLITPQLYSRAGEFKRLPYDPADAKKLLAEAGYPDGFELTMHCPNDRYVNDEQICLAVTSMLAKIGVKAKLEALPKAVFFGRAGLAGGYDTSFGMLGWTPSGFDSLNIFQNLTGCRDDKGNGSPFNYGGYCNPKVDALIPKISVETDPEKRLDYITQAYRMLTDDVSHIPLHQQALSWGVSKKVKLVQRADDILLYQWVVKSE
ncbi:MAG: ABC transporter substrate-binding protein [Hyphomicrobiales bacterium]|nr:ABC transporter substrate-binding protein [Hyphomicrobiales bacterium]